MRVPKTGLPKKNTPLTGLNWHVYYMYINNTYSYYTYFSWYICLLILFTNFLTDCCFHHSHINSCLHRFTFIQLFVLSSFNVNLIKGAVGDGWVLKQPKQLLVFHAGKTKSKQCLQACDLDWSVQSPPGQWVFYGFFQWPRPKPGSCLASELSELL